MPPFPPRDPGEIAHPVLRECAERAEWLAVVAAAMADLEPQAADVRFGRGDPAAQESLAESLAVLLRLARVSLDETAKDLDQLLLGWLAEDPEHWGIFRLMLLDAWQPAPGQWYEGTPPWVFVLVAKAAALQERGDLIIPR